MTCALGQPSSSITASASSSMSSVVYAGLDPPISARHGLSFLPEAKCVDSPASRLSNRATANPRATSASQKASGHHSIWKSSPMIPSSGTPVAVSPNVS